MNKSKMTTQLKALRANTVELAAQATEHRNLIVDNPVAVVVADRYIADLQALAVNLDNIISGKVAQLETEDLDR